MNEDTKRIEYAVSLNGEKHVIEMQATVLHEEILESQFNKLQGLAYVRYEGQMLAILKDYDEDIMSINYDNSEENGRRRGVYKILSKSHKKALPLNVYGDGTKKVVLLIVVAWNQRGCGRIYYRNKDNDPYNDTATFEQAQVDATLEICLY